MGTRITFMLKEAEKFRNTPPGVALQLRLGLAQIVSQRMDELRWTPIAVAKMSGLEESYIDEVLHANADFTTEIAGKLLFALGLKD
ncbi:hypothetical protein LCGC14_2329260 [marine sediment metagenome]|uniref:HigA2-like helix-turn-helix domain-containing protein n=1 Tax=marine sediment metagenome TaxID=412755 RepID=A0A0F9CFB9_9ZZZZ